MTMTGVVRSTAAVGRSRACSERNDHVTSQASPTAMMSDAATNTASLVNHLAVLERSNCTPPLSCCATKARSSRIGRSAKVYPPLYGKGEEPPRIFGLRLRVHTADPAA